MKSGDTVDIGVADDEKNIKANRNGNTVDFELNKNLDLDATGSIFMGDVLVSGKGLTINNGPSMTVDGINAGNKTITNVAAGTALTDAVNVSQLKEVSNNITNLGNRINDVEDNANAGTAAAMAMANLPQPAYAGEGGMSLGVGTYQGESGYAVGYSAISENGNWVFKASATGNSQGKFGAGAGVFFKMH